MILKNGMDLNDSDDCNDERHDTYEDMMNCIIRSAETGAFHCPLLVQLVRLYRESNDCDGVSDAFGLSVVSHFAQHLYDRSLSKYIVYLKSEKNFHVTDIFASNQEHANRSAWNLLRESNYDAAEVQRYSDDGELIQAFSVYDPTTVN